MGKQISGAQKRKKKKEKEEAVEMLDQKGENVSEQLEIHRLRSLLRTTRVRKLLPRKRVPGTNGRTIR